ncbi:hypothetical protein ACFTZJ_22135 [Streptomyces globisporus]|uniref:hypothetical protein n=1 Tax=Streptomyces globisporus TaxID=1908 RepID=UPI00363BB460
MDDSTDKPPAHSDQEHAAHLGKHIRRALLGLVLMAVPFALNGAGLLTRPGWAWPLWACQTLGMGLLVVTGFRIVLGPVGQRLNTPARPAPRVPASLEVQAHQRRMDGGQAPC